MVLIPRHCSNPVNHGISSTIAQPLRSALKLSPSGIHSPRNSYLLRGILNITNPGRNSRTPLQSMINSHIHISSAWPVRFTFPLSISSRRLYPNQAITIPPRNSSFTQSSMPKTLKLSSLPQHYPYSNKMAHRLAFPFLILRTPFFFHSNLHLVAIFPNIFAYLSPFIYHNIQRCLPNSNPYSSLQTPTTGSSPKHSADSGTISMISIAATTSWLRRRWK